MYISTNLYLHIHRYIRTKTLALVSSKIHDIISSHIFTYLFTILYQSWLWIFKNNFPLTFVSFPRRKCFVLFTLQYTCWWLRIRLVETASIGRRGSIIGILIFFNVRDNLHKLYECFMFISFISELKITYVYSSSWCS